MGLFHSLGGQVRLALTSADPPRTLTQIRSLGIEVSQIQYVDELCIHMTVSRPAWVKIGAYAGKKGYDARVLHRYGLFWSLASLVRRPVLVIGVTLLLLLSLLLPGRILFVQVEGNHLVATNYILETAARHGVCMGASARELRSERIKNALLEEIPQLQWLGVNARGCVAVISVRERKSEPRTEPATALSHLVAKTDGIIASVTVTSGSALCKPGDAVTRGQTLISGYTDLGICLQATQAKGDVFAITQRKITAITPGDFRVRGDLTGADRKYALLIGNKRINFYKSSGILDASCARIYSVWYMTLPGGFYLPIGIVKETLLQYETAADQGPQFDLAAAAREYVLSQLTDGQILVTNAHEQQDDTVRIIRGSYVCREMIAQVQIEEN